MHCNVRFSVYTRRARGQLGVLGGAGRGGGSLDIFAPGASRERGSVPAGWSRRLIEKLPRLASPQWPGYKKCLEEGGVGWLTCWLFGWLVIGHPPPFPGPSTSCGPPGLSFRPSSSSSSSRPGGNEPEN